MTFWNALNKPIMALAPMADVTDVAFRRIIAKYGAPDVFWTEFVSADGLYHTREIEKTPDEANPLMRDLDYSEAERPIVAQLFTATPERMRYGAALARELGFDGVDINMGCPDRSIEKQGTGAALIENPELACELIAAAKEGAGDIPVSVKTRIGYSCDELDTWLPALLSANPAVVTLHARTRSEMSKVPAQWDAIARAVEIRDEAGSEALIFGNGDVENLTHARALVAATGADGVMLGRAIFGNPWLFAEYEPTIEEKLSVMVEHTKLFEELLPHKNFAVMKKHYKAYVNGFDGAKELRVKLFEEANNAADVERIVTEYLSHGK